MRRRIPCVTLLAVFTVLAGVSLFAAGSLLAGVTGSPHDFSSTGPYTKTLATGGVCSICHVPHGAKDTVLWPRFLGEVNSSGYRRYMDKADGNGDNNYIYGRTLQCYDCHDYAGSPNPFTGTGTGNEQNILDNNSGSSDPPKGSFAVNHRPQDIAFGLRYSTSIPPSGGYDGDWTDDGPGGSVAGYFENDPPHGAPGRDDNVSGRFGVGDPSGTPATGGHYFKTGDAISTTLKRGDKIPCSDCHDPHDYTAQAFIKKSVRDMASPPINEASEYMSNKVNSTPISRARNNLDSRNMCNACHTLQGSGFINYSQVNTVYSSVNIVQRPDYIAEHLAGSGVPCTQCHKHNSVFASCSQCHGYPPGPNANPAYPLSARFVPTAPLDNDSHPRHYGALSGQSRTGLYRINCEVCHYGSTGAGGSLGHHQNDNVSVVLQGAWTKNGGTYDNTNYFNLSKVPTYPAALPSFTGQLDNTTGSKGWGDGTRYGGNACRNVYCHSAGRVQTSMGLDCTVDYRVPRWNSGTQHCNDCHGYGTDNTTVYFGMPNYASVTAGSATANSHRKHIDAGYECFVCHSTTVTAGTGANRAILSSSPTKHVNGIREVVFDGTIAKNGTRNPPYDNSVGVKTCSVSCHGSAYPQWGGTLANGCFGCHSGAEAINKPQDNVWMPNPVDNDEYAYSGHGRSGTNYPGSNNLPAGFSNYTTAPVSCYVCHSQTAAHTTRNANDPFRLGYDNDTTGQSGTLKGAFADNTDLLCLGCHGTTTQRSGHDNTAKGTTTVDVLTHARGITGTKYNWPGSNYPWKCVDCHDPHGDGKSGAERYMMLRSGINAPVDNNDANAGSDAKSRPKNSGANVLAVSFNSLAGYSTTGGVYSYANQGSVAPWGPCEVCHTQTTAFSRTLDNTSSHASRTSRCTTCHPHKSGFAATACKGCHGPDSVATGQRSPDVGAYWTSSGHGMTTPKAINIECEACHDVGYLTGLEHKTDGSVAGVLPLNLNTLGWPTKASSSTNRNTSHLAPSYFPTGTPASKYQYALAFDRKCGDPVAGCHPAYAHGHKIHPKVPAGSTNPADNVLTFDPAGNLTVANPKSYYWYLPVISGTDYATRFYESPSPWVIGDLTTSADNASLSGNNTQYGVCVTCHDPHGTNAPANIPGATTNLMLRGNSKNQPQFCNYVCHGSRTPP